MIVDRKIIEDCKAGKRRAQNRLYQKYAGVMLGVCLRYSKNLVEAEDVLQEGFIKVFSNISKLKDCGAIEAWIRRIMANTAITHCNKKKIYFEEINDDMLTEPDQDENTFLPVDPDVLMDIIQNLPEGYRMVLNLYIFEGFSHKEIANALNITESTSKSQLFKARKSIKKTLEDMHLMNQNLVENETRI